jgi:hypothetical protein
LVNLAELSRRIGASALRLFLGTLATAVLYSAPVYILTAALIAQVFRYSRF